MKNTFIIAEIGQAHEGSLGVLHSYIDAVAKTGVDAIKFQTHIAEAESSEYESFRINFSYEDSTRYDYWKRMEFSPDQWIGIKKHCEEVGLEFMSSAFSIAAVELLEGLGMKRFKIGSGETQNFLMLDRIARTGKPILLSTGMSSYEELDETMAFLSGYSNQIGVFQCTTAYPTSPSEVGLNVIPEMIDRYQVPVGLSDHSGTIYPCLAAASLGASMLEVHVVFHKGMFGPDTKASITLEELAQLAQGVRMIDESLNHPIDKHQNEKFLDLKKLFGKSLAVNRPLEAGHIISHDDLETKKPAGRGIDAADYQSVIGRKLAVSLEKYSFLNNEDLV